MAKFLAAVHHQYGEPLVVDEIEVGDPGPHHVFLKLFSSGICHSQLHQIHGITTPRPLLLGHEATGVVVKAGSKVSSVREGDRVMIAVLPHTAIGDGPTNPTEARWRGQTIVTPTVYTWSEYAMCDERYVVALDATAPTDITSVLGCAVITGAGAVVNTAGVQEGESVAVFGAGGIGLSTLAAAQIVGAHPIIAIDIDAEKLEFSRQFGATHLVDASTTDPVDAIKEITGGGAEWVFDAIGVRQTQEQITRAARPGVFGLRDGGTAVLIGVPQESATIDTRDLLYGAKRLMGTTVGSCKIRRDLPRFLDWYQRGRFPLEELVTKRYTLDQVNEGVDDLTAGRIFGRSIMVYDTP